MKYRGKLTANLLAEVAFCHVDTVLFLGCTACNGTASLLRV
jgi:hypothetical protein